MKPCIDITISISAIFIFRPHIEAFFDCSYWKKGFIFTRSKVLSSRLQQLKKIGRQYVFQRLRFHPSVLSRGVARIFSEVHTFFQIQQGEITPPPPAKALPRIVVYIFHFMTSAWVLISCARTSYLSLLQLNALFIARHTLFSLLYSSSAQCTYNKIVLPMFH